MSVAAHVFDETPPPQELIRALNYKSWGVVDIMSLPAGLLRKMNLCLSYYHALMGYIKAAKHNKTVEFTKNNPVEWDMVSRFIA